MQHRTRRDLRRRQRARQPLAARPHPGRGAARRLLRAQLAGGRSGPRRRRAGARRGRLDRLHVRPRRPRPRRRSHPGRQRGRHGRRRLGGTRHPHHAGLVRRDQGHLGPQRRAGDRLAALRPDPQRLRPRRRQRGPRPGGVRARATSRRPDLCRDRGLRQPFQRVPHDRTAPGRRRDGRGHPGRPGRGAARPRGRRLHQRPRLRHQAERQARDRRVQAEPRRSRTPGAGQLHQVDDRPLARRDRLPGDRGQRPGHQARHRAADRQPPRARPRLRPGLHPAGRPRAAHRHGAQRRQRIRRLPERHGAHHPASGEAA